VKIGKEKTVMPRKSRNPHICFDRVLEGQQAIDAAVIAINERPDNAGFFGGPAAAPASTPLPGGPAAMPAPPGMPFAMALLTRTMWAVGRSLRVRFLEGTDVMKAKVEQVAHAWEQYANIKFVFGADPDAEIRISFTHDPGSWSYLGTDALTIPKTDPTMNYGWLRDNTPNDEYNRVTLHEFGHALGCIHEHQNPTAAIPWNKPVVYRYYGGSPNNWSQAQVDANLFQKYGTDITQYTDFDLHSIMLYPISKDMTTGGYEVGLNIALSDLDKAFISKVYPKVVKQGVELTIAAAPVPAVIGTAGEEDMFNFTAAAAGTYTIETSGATDVVMGLFGPDDVTKSIARDDDSGVGTNARIVQVLQPGVYFVRIRHFRPTGTGQYTISVVKSA
jgi:hypothetical protein